MLRTNWLSAVMVLALAGTGFAQNTEEITEETKPEKRARATSVDFTAELGLNFASLTGLGARIEQAYQAADPVGLASAARDLAVAESVSGKEASITSAELTERAVALAKMRFDEAELKAVAMLVDDEETADELKQVADDAAAFAEELAKAAENDEDARGILGSLTVYNYSFANVDVYYNGRYLGWVGARAKFTFSVHSHANHFNLYAEDAYGNFWRWSDNGDFSSYWWDLYAP
ncbi:MAG: hypothetical protein DWQ34_05120 [Planctomycetota bacterium]|nr:MAG: hypothetical protein DWQ29_11615 [Planctomycetota bacterium]REJ95954.1 MAG: hypothetical protein DWQ34_05120 [Planctomycetota bacterium]REK29228.1 MAG: hypothetical protein DWQ41_04560 [Planctomycetota bacterium]REK29412.1 MAG: hypothetical protein DWQ45_22850 [Planctomycetota bacterium]